MTSVALKNKIKAQGATVKWRTLEVDAWGEPESKNDAGEPVPAKPFVIKVKTLSMDEYKSWADRLKDGDPGERVLLLMDRAYDEKGAKRLFDPTSKDDYRLLREDADPLVIGAIVAEIMRWGDRSVTRKN